MESKSSIRVAGSPVLRRSDGTHKLYGLNKDGKLLTVVFRQYRIGKWAISEIALDGRITFRAGDK